jgi:hypothetical protein
MGAGRGPKYNASGLPDLTAYEAISQVIKEEKELDERVRNLISVLKFIIDWAGFELISRIEIRHKKTRKEFR